jgi:hypothetical protein
MDYDHDGRPFIQIGRLRLYVSTAAEADEAAMTVCGNVSYFADDVRGECAGCGAPLVFRPHMPARPPKLCLDCALLFVRAQGPPQ